jgi:hypothetical protein
LPAVDVQVAVSARQVHDPDRLAAAVETALQASGLTPARLTVTVPTAAPSAGGTLQRLRALGVRIMPAGHGIAPAADGQKFRCYFDNSLFPASAIPEVLQRHALLSNPDLQAE